MRGVWLVEIHNSLLQEACQQFTQLSVVPSWLGSHMIKSSVATTHTLRLSPTPYSAVTLPARGNVKCDDDGTDGNHATEKGIAVIIILLYIMNHGSGS